MTLLAAGCSGTTDPRTGDLQLDLAHRDPRIRADSARLTALLERPDLTPALITNLGDDDPVVRAWSAAALRKLSRRDFGFQAYGDHQARQRAVRRWEIWWRERSPNAPEIMLGN